MPDEEKRSRGRPRVKINLDEVRELASEGCTQEEICRALGIARSTFALRKDALKAYYDGFAELKISLRHWQVSCAKEGNVQMLIWLGRNLLDQKDKPGEMNDSDGSGKVVIRDDIGDDGSTE